MTYAHDDEAREQAAAHPASEETTQRLAQAAADKSASLGPEGVRAHSIRFSTGSWEGLLDQLSPQVAATGVITRGDVFDVAAQVRSGERAAADLFTASFLWGTGTTGYGAARYRAIVADAGAALEGSLRRAVSAADQPGTPEPVAGYIQLYGGDGKNRAAPGEQPWSRLHRFGPAFFTKFLYFSVPGALILDIVLAGAAKRLSGLPHLLDNAGKAEPWTPYRYAVYLHWMNQTATAAGTTPDMLEMTLFNPQATKETDEGPNAD
jgi:hypothetical protein